MKIKLAPFGEYIRVLSLRRRRSESGSAWMRRVKEFASAYAKEQRLEVEVEFHGHALLNFFRSGAPRPEIYHPATGDEEEYWEVFPLLTLWVD